ncbi:Serine/threonine protein kinase [Handroanthus impetiginosus]|uniref:Serine/threonine protein kinase n=1 Tax=Handroanthus impetiginosus TaxID=429701 RepID=A0A2G9I4H4_9LAMI|nr:Serine/threonine protein kinase [Handroanthus impetiginosus]
MDAKPFPKMYNPKPNQKPILLFILLSIHFPSFFSQQLNNSSCSNEPFQCGSIRYITYPFWGGRRPLSCGHPGFQLVCNGGVPMLNMSSLSYRVQEIDFSANTLRVARQDLWNNTCPEAHRNTTIDPDLFRYLPESNDRNITLYFDCTSDQGRLSSQFRCDGDGANTINLFRTGNASSGPGSGITCNNDISVPVNHTAADSLRTQQSINALLAALATGFWIQWWEDEKQYLTPFCNPNVYGSCGIGSIGPLPSPTPAQGIPPIQSPAYAPAPLSDHNGSYHHPSPGYARIILGVTLGIIGIALVSITIYCWRRRRRLQKSPNQNVNPNQKGKPNQKGNQHVENILLQHGSLAPKRYKYSEIKKITKSFNDKLGQGGYGSVYKGILPDGCVVAVKVLIETDSNGEEFINEVASISRTSHVNIVNLLGFCYDRNKRALVYEFMPNKSLDKFVSSSANCQLDKETLYKIALGVAKGLEYLHTGCNTRIVHFDIKPQNILLDEDFCPKISDFGLAKLCKKKQSILSVPGARGTIGYIAPEIFSRNFGGVSHKSDVYSYGMMVLAMAGARNVGETMAIQSSENYFPDKIYEDVILDVTRKLDDCIEEEDDTTRKMFLVGFWCIQTNSSDRPSMSKVVEMLEGSLHSIQIPPKPFLFSPVVARQEFSPSLSEHVETENLTEH